ncbi:hypothetical protein VNO78_10761 [Psophocarpus tetragonolobus]|uniref:Uncharacterized protein n=1 Tax=Psophocarpus tetragonolobus TaxID=3891 RepID=A0AAN9SMZ5_PSOTE
MVILSFTYEMLEKNLLFLLTLFFSKTSWSRFVSILSCTRSVYYGHVTRRFKPKHRCPLLPFAYGHKVQNYCEG